MRGIFNFNHYLERMNKDLAEKIDEILYAMEKGEWTAEQCMDETRREQRGIFDYLFREENELLTSNENHQLLFMHAIFWKLRKSKQVISPNEIEELEDLIWAESEIDDFPYASALPEIEALDDEIVAVIIDCVDNEIHSITGVGAQWIMIKGFVLAILLRV